MISALLLQNPVLVLGLDLPFVIATSDTLRNAAAISIMLLFIHMITMPVGKLTAGRMPRWLRMLCHALVAMVVMVLARALVRQMFGDTIQGSLGMYIYLMGVNGMTLYQAFTVRRRDRLPRILLDAFQNVLGFTVVMFLLALVREPLGWGTLWDRPVNVPVTLIGFRIQFVGFIAVGFLLALGRFLNKKITGFLVAEAARMDRHYVDIRQGRRRR